MPMTPRDTRAFQKIILLALVKPGCAETGDNWRDGLKGIQRVIVMMPVLIIATELISVSLDIVRTAAGRGIAGVKSRRLDKSML